MIAVTFVRLGQLKAVINKDILSSAASKHFSFAWTTTNAYRNNDIVIYLIMHELYDEQCV